MIAKLAICAQEPPGGTAFSSTVGPSPFAIVPLSVAPTTDPKRTELGAWEIAICELPAKAIEGKASATPARMMALQGPILIGAEHSLRAAPQVR